MSDSSLSANLKRFLRDAVPTFPAAEFLVFLAVNSKARFRAAEIVGAMKPAVITEAAAAEYFRVFHEYGLVKGDAANGFEFSPSSEEKCLLVDELLHAYNERPVTLIRIIDSLARSKIQSFADSFKIKDA